MLVSRRKVGQSATRLIIDPRQRASNRRWLYADNRRWLYAEHPAADEVVAAAIQENGPSCAVCRDAPEVAPPWKLFDPVELIIRNGKVPYRVHLRKPTTDAEAEKSPILGFVTTPIIVAAMLCDTLSADGAPRKFRSSSATLWNRRLVFSASEKPHLAQDFHSQFVGRVAEHPQHHRPEILRVESAGFSPLPPRCGLVNRIPVSAGKLL